MSRRRPYFGGPLAIPQRLFSRPLHDRGDIPLHSRDPAEPVQYLAEEPQSALITGLAEEAQIAPITRQRLSTALSHFDELDEPKEVIESKGFKTSFIPLARLFDS